MCMYIYIYIYNIHIYHIIYIYIYMLDMGNHEIISHGNHPPNRLFLNFHTNHGRSMINIILNK